MKAVRLGESWRAVSSASSKRHMGGVGFVPQGIDNEEVELREVLQRLGRDDLDVGEVGDALPVGKDKEKAVGG